MLRYRHEFYGAAPVDVVAREAGYGYSGYLGSEEFLLYSHGCFFRYEYVIVAGGAEGLADGLIDYVVAAAFADLLRRDVGVADFGSAYLNVGYGDGRTEGGVCIFVRGSAQDC